MSKKVTKKSDFVLELHTEMFAARNALTRFERTEKPSEKAKKALDAHISKMKDVTKQLAETREALLKEIE